MTLKERILMLAPVVLALPLCELVDAVVRILPRRLASRQDGRKRLLIVRLDMIGDFILFLDSFKEYRKLFPPDQWEITLLGNRVWSGLAERLPYADHYVFMDTRKFVINPVYRFRILRDIRSYRFDHAIEPTYSRSALLGDSVVHASCAPVRAGSTGNFSNMTGWQKRRADRWYTRLIPARVLPLNELDRNAEFLRGLGLDTFEAAPPRYPHDVLTDRSTLDKFGIAKPYFIIFPGASLQGRQWPSERFAEIARRLFISTKWIPVLCGGPKDIHVARRVAAHAPELPWVYCAGITTLSQMMSVLAESRMLIANETGVIHMAAAVECPTVCIMGGGHFGRFYPYSGVRGRIAYKPMDCFGCDWWCRYPTVRCIREITIDDVWKEVDSLAKEMS